MVRISAYYGPDIRALWSGFQRIMVQISAYYGPDISVIWFHYQRIMVRISAYYGPNISVLRSGYQRVMVRISAYYGPDINKLWICNSGFYGPCINFFPPDYGKPDYIGLQVGFSTWIRWNPENGPVFRFSGLWMISGQIRTIIWKNTVENPEKSGTGLHQNLLCIDLKNTVGIDFGR